MAGEVICEKKKCKKHVVGIVTFDLANWFTSHQSHYCLYYNGIPEFVRKRSMLPVRQLKQRKIFEISLSESRIYKWQMVVIIREISDSNQGETVQNLESPRLSGRVENPLYEDH